MVDDQKEAVPRVTVKALFECKQRIDVLRLLSFDPGVYLLEVEQGGRRSLVVDDSGSPCSWRSQLAAKQPFKGLDIVRCVMRHRSSYNEMIGMPGGDDTLEVCIACPDEDLS